MRFSVDPAHEYYIASLIDALPFASAQTNYGISYPHEVDRLTFRVSVYQSSRTSFVCLSGLVYPDVE